MGCAQVESASPVVQGWGAEVDGESRAADASRGGKRKRHAGGLGGVGGAGCGDGDARRGWRRRGVEAAGGDIADRAAISRGAGDAPGDCFGEGARTLNRCAELLGRPDRDGTGCGRDGDASRLVGGVVRRDGRVAADSQVAGGGRGRGASGPALKDRCGANRAGGGQDERCSCGVGEGERGDSGEFCRKGPPGWRLLQRHLWDLRNRS